MESGRLVSEEQPDSESQVKAFFLVFFEFSDRPRQRRERGAALQVKAVGSESDNDSSQYNLQHSPCLSSWRRHERCDSQRKGGVFRR